jgi:SAM-dependent methyltransferase
MKHERSLNGFDLTRCRRCQCVYVNPQLATEELWKLYSERDAETLIRLYSRIQSSQMKQQHDRILGSLERRSPGGKRLLDFGCGAGYFVERAAERGWEACGLEAGEWAREAARARGVSCVHVGSLAEGIFPPGHFDVACANQVFEHLPAPREELLLIRESLRPNGLFYANVPNYACLSIVLGRDDFELNTPPQHLNYFTPHSLRNLVTSCGFQVLDVSSYGGLKWENLLGWRVRSEIADAYRPQPAGEAASAGSGPRPVARGSVTRLAKRLIMPLIEVIFYRGMKVGMSLQITARKRGS